MANSGFSDSSVSNSSADSSFNIYTWCRYYFANAIISDIELTKYASGESE